MEFGNNGFWGEGENGVPRAVASMTGFEHGPHWCMGGKCSYYCAKKRRMLYYNRIIYSGIYDWLNEQDAGIFNCHPWMFA